MKRILLKLSVILMVVLVVSWAVAAKKAETPSEPPQSGADFLQQWMACNESKTYPSHDQFIFAYRRVSHKWDGSQVTERIIIREGKGKGNPFGILEVMKDIEHLRNVEAIPENKETYSMVLLEGFTVTERQEVQNLDAKALCQMDGGRPRRFIFQADGPRGWAVQQLQVVYTWDFYPFNEASYWAPVEILTECLVRRGARQALTSERWTLEKILAVRDTGVGPIREVAKKP